MIFGIGTDIVATERLSMSIERLGNRFAQKILGAQEWDEYQHRLVGNSSRGLRYLSTRFAAKEALAKACGIGFRPPMSWHNAQILNDVLGAPVLHTSGELSQFFIDRRLKATISLSDEVDYAVAFVVLEVT